jgi:hypothetical protein
MRLLLAAFRHLFYGSIRLLLAFTQRALIRTVHLLYAERSKPVGSRNNGAIYSPHSTFTMDFSFTQRPTYSTLDLLYTNEANRWGVGSVTEPANPSFNILWLGIIRFSLRYFTVVQSLYFHSCQIFATMGLLNPFWLLFPHPIKSVGYGCHNGNGGCVFIDKSMCGGEKVNAHSPSLVQQVATHSFSLQNHFTSKIGAISLSRCYQGGLRMFWILLF